MRIGVGLLVVLGAAGVCAQVTPRPAAAPIPVVVELFTSEGCSSCPPADKVLIDLLRDQPIAGVQIVGLSEHVDYWDQLGWKDPFSNASFTARQSAYSTAQHSSDIYTPQIVVDGTAAMVGSDRAAVVAAITAAVRVPKANVELMSIATAQPPTRTATMAASAATAHAVVTFAIVEDGLSSDVKRGENSGHTLAHSAVTRVLTPLGTCGADGAFQSVIPVKIAPAWNASALTLIVFAQKAPNGPIIAAGSMSLR